MYLIADGGSTKIDWTIVKSNKELINFNSPGLNPSILSEIEIENQLKAIFELNEVRSKIKQVYFYGAGCGSKNSKKNIQFIFKKFFSKAEVIIKEDIYAAVYATSKKEACIVSIIGTGSNSTYYNGNKIIKGIPSLGYTIMDEASGNYFGKILLRDYFYMKMPEHIRNTFNSTYNLDIDIIKDELYKKEYPNKYLAQLSKFMFDLKDDDYIKNTISTGFDLFIENRIKTIDNYQKLPLHFVGSIAYYYKEILIDVLNQNNLNIGTIIQKPIHNLIKYHNI